MVLQVTAHDADHGSYGKLEYMLIEKNNSICCLATDYFAINPASGIIRTRRNLDDAFRNNNFTFRFDVKVRDNPDSSNNSYESIASVIINIISPENFLVLSIDGVSLEVLRKERAKIVEILEYRTGLLIEIEKIELRKLLSNNSINKPQTDGDVWFYAVDVQTERILSRNDELLYK